MGTSPWTPAATAGREPVISDGMADVLRTIGLSGDRDLGEDCALALGVDGVAVSLLLDETAMVEPLWSFPDSSARFEELQFTLGEGPGPDAVRTGTAVLEPDLRAARVDRWPALLPAALPSPVRGVFCFPLGIGAIRIGLLTALRHDPRGLSPQQVSDALALAAALTAAFIGQRGTGPSSPGRRVEPPSELHRAVVHQATGMVSVQLSVPLAEALVRLRAFAYGSERTLTDVARDVVARNLRFGDPTSGPNSPDGGKG